MPSPTSTDMVVTRPPPRKPPGPDPIPMARAGYELPEPVRHIKRTYSWRRKLDVLLFLENHRIPLRDDLSDLVANRLEGAGPVEEGFRRPFLREAAAHFGIRSWGTVQTWWARRNEIWQGPRRRARRYNPRWPDLEARLYSEFCSVRQGRRLVQRSWFRRRSVALFAELYPEDPDGFVFSNGWFRGFLKRFQITHRRVTHASTRVPEEIVDSINEFLQFVRRNSRMAESWMRVTLMSDPVGGLSLQRFPPHLIVNLDETPMPFEFLDGFTFDHKGTQSVQGRSERSGWSKRQATLVLAIVGDGESCDSHHFRPVIIFHGKGNVQSREQPLYHPGVEVKFNDTAYNNETLFEEWIRTRLAVYTEGRECLLVIDVASFHKTPKIQDTLKEFNITTALIPPGLTGYLQPLDVGFNGPFKKWLREETDLYLDRLDQSGTTPVRWSIRDRRIMATHIVAKAWERVSQPQNRSMIAGLFKKTGISIHPDGREDHLISIKGIDNGQLRLDDWYLPPERRTNDISALDGDANADSTSVDYSTLTNKVLRDLCRERGLRVGGCKAELTRRLQEADAAGATQMRHREQAIYRESDRGSDQNVTSHDTQVVQPAAADPVYAPGVDIGTRPAISRASGPEAGGEDTPDIPPDGIAGSS